MTIVDTSVRAECVLRGLADRLARDRQATGTDADLVAELVRRADTAVAGQKEATADLNREREYAREQAVAAERYRQLRAFVRRWLDAGLIPADHEEHVRGLISDRVPR